MRRLHLLELEDQPWFPRALRDCMTDFLSFLDARADPFSALVPKVRAIVEQQRCRAIVDLCSGAGSPSRGLQGHLSRELGSPVSLVLTDKYPNISAFEAISSSDSSRTCYISESVDATAVPAQLTGFRTLFNSFHHFPPNMAHRILEDAVERRQPIGVFELADRAVLNLLAMIGNPITLWLVTPFIRPFRLTRLFWTYVIPALPLALMWDGIVSCLRAYSPRELKGLVADLQREDYRWEVGTKRVFLGLGKITYLLGYPVTRET